MPLIDRAAAVAPLMLGFLFWAPAAQAGICGSILDPMTVSADALMFSYTPPSDSAVSAGITMSCGLLGLDLLPAIAVSISAGDNGVGAARRLRMGAAYLNYNIYTDSGHGTVWGDGNNGTVTQGVNGSLLHLGTYSFTAYGLVRAGQYVAAGTYGDTLTVLVTF